MGDIMEKTKQITLGGDMVSLLDEHRSIIQKKVGEDNLKRFSELCIKVHHDLTKKNPRISIWSIVCAVYNAFNRIRTKYCYGILLYISIR